MTLLESYKPMCLFTLQTFNFQLDRDSRSADRNAFAVEGRLSGLIMTPSYSSSNALRNSGAKLGAVMSGDRTLIPFFLITDTHPKRDGINEDFNLALVDVDKPLDEKAVEHNE